MHDVSPQSPLHRGKLTFDEKVVVHRVGSPRDQHGTLLDASAWFKCRVHQHLRFDIRVWDSGYRVENLGYEVSGDRSRPLALSQQVDFRQDDFQKSIDFGESTAPGRGLSSWPGCIRGSRPPCAWRCPLPSSAAHETG